MSFCDIYSIDVPSGLFADKQNLKDDTIIKAKKTFTFQSPKLTFFFEENYIFTGDWEILNIELSELFIANQPVSNFYISNLLINRFKKIRPKISHKGTFGYGLLWAGNTQMAGAAMLASKASLKTGAGKITVFTSLENKVPLNVFCPEAVISINFPEKIDLFTAIAIGPGLGTENKTIENLRKFLKLKIKVPLVLDADALNILADNPELIVDLPANCILTPHPKEFKNMVKKNWANSEEKFEILKNFAKQTNCIIVLKGAYTAIALPDGELYLNNAGNSALAKAGTGDVLTGIILGLLCQGYSELEAAITAVYEHGKAAERFTEKYTMRSLLASELINYIQ